MAEPTRRLEQIHDFLIFADRFKHIVRQNYLTDGSRRENDAEHTWHMALYALLLKDEIGFEVDIGRTLARSEEHTSELQSLMRISYAVFCLKKKTKINKYRQ